MNSPLAFPPLRGRLSLLKRGGMLYFKSFEEVNNQDLTPYPSAVRRGESNRKSTVKRDLSYL
jgi:hypothetical protein